MTEALPQLSNEEIKRYSRHLIMPEVGMDGQRRLKAGRVLCIGAGGLGSPAAMYLAAAGVGTIGLVDFDVVDFSNLQRQVIHGTPDVGRPKLDSARDRLLALNPHVEVKTYETALSSENALGLFEPYDVILDGTDNFPTRYLTNDACVLLGKPNAYGSIFRFEGQASVFGAKAGPCYRCLYPEPPPPGLVPSCADLWRRDCHAFYDVKTQIAEHRERADRDRQGLQRVALQIQRPQFFAVSNLWADGGEPVILEREHLRASSACHDLQKKKEGGGGRARQQARTKSPEHRTRRT